MQRLIDADTAKHEFNLHFGGVSHAVIAGQILDEQPTIDPVHAAGACYCRECRFYNPGDEEWEPFCFKPHGLAGYLPTTPDSFCSFGVKKEEYHEV